MCAAALETCQLQVEGSFRPITVQVSKDELLARQQHLVVADESHWYLGKWAKPNGSPVRLSQDFPVSNSAG